MRRLSQFILVTTVALGAAVVVYVGFTLPPSSQRLSPAPANLAYGAYHVHTDQSDGSGTFDDVANAAARAGLQFVIITDHGTATRTPEAPHYRQGVLLIDAVEISTISGHLVALGLDRASAYPLGAEARDTIEDVHRMGGWTVIAHPDSVKPDLRWRGTRLNSDGVDGVEWLNADSEWRDESVVGLLGTVGRYLFRAPEAIATLFDRPTASLRRWDQLNATRHVVGLAAVDAHARIGLDETDESRHGRTMFARPSYEDMFRTVVQAVELSAPLQGHAGDDATAVLEALRHGRTFSVVAAQASPGHISFQATDGTLTAAMGESLPSDRPVRLYAEVDGPANATVALFRDGREVASHQGRVEFQHMGSAAGYRVEVRLPNRAVPWIVTNPIRVGVMSTSPGLRQDLAPQAPVVSTLDLDNASLWTVEKHLASTGTLRSEGREEAMDFALAPGRPNGQYAAMVYPLNGQDSFDRVTLKVRAAAEMRVSVQVRLPGGTDGERWQRSMFVSPVARTVTLRLEDFEPTNTNTTRRPIVARVQSLLIVVDTWHTSPGTKGTIWISDVSLGAPRVPATFEPSAPSSPPRQ